MTVLFGDDSTTRSSTKPVAVLPLLVILFIASYAILTMLVFEQGQTIESQRTLIREMLKDSNQLATLKDKIAREDKRKAALQPDHVDPTANNAVAPNAGNAPAANGKPAKRSNKSARTMNQAPGKPAADLEDVRRLTKVI